MVDIKAVKKVACECFDLHLPKDIQENILENREKLYKIICECKAIKKEFSHPVLDLMIDKYSYFDVGRCDPRSIEELDKELQEALEDMGGL